jgi:hypothetical protein
VGILGAWLLTLQSLALPLLSAPAAESCCCAHRDANCRCKVCSHGRELEAGTPVLRTCETTPAPAAILGVGVALPTPAETPRAQMVTPDVPQARAAEPTDHVREVPTPPPLQRV